jgi:hypothetical protein
VGKADHPDQPGAVKRAAAAEATKEDRPERAREAAKAAAEARDRDPAAKVAKSAGWTAAASVEKTLAGCPAPAWPVQVGLEEEWAVAAWLAAALLVAAWPAEE